MQIKITNLTRKIQNKTILNNINLEVKKGEVLSLIGPSGSGKTSLLRSLIGLDENIIGDIIFNEKCKNKGMIFQNFNIFPHKTVLENVIEALIIVEKMDKSRAIEKGMELLELVGLLGKENQMPKTISGGEKQRVAIARALARNPDILFLDEPTSALDPEMATEVLKVIKSLRNLGITLVLSSHEMEFVKEISDTIIFMENGSIVSKGTPKEFFLENINPRISDFVNKRQAV